MVPLLRGLVPSHHGQRLLSLMSAIDLRVIVIKLFPAFKYINSICELYEAIVALAMGFAIDKRCDFHSEIGWGVRDESCD